MTVVESVEPQGPESRENGVREVVPRGGAVVDSVEDHRELMPQTRRALLRRLAIAQAEGRAPSMMGAVVRGGEVVWTGARSAVDGEVPHGDVQYRIGSLTKNFVAVLVLRLRDEGLVELDDPIGSHLADVPVPEATIAQLLSHSAGLAAESRGPWWERTAGELRPSRPTCSVRGHGCTRRGAGTTTPTPASRSSGRWSNGCGAGRRGARCCAARCWSRWA